jgi:DNA repair protein RecN (Recombination protein N)
MLRTLNIRDFVIVERLELEFERGFTVLTGETGAGKSILIDALALVLGERADAIVVRQGAERAEITAEFELESPSALTPWLEQRDLESDGVCLLRRVIEASGRGRAFINGTPVTLAQLREAGEFLVDIHGQHEHQSLVRAASQRALLDAYGGHAALASRVAELYRAWRQRVDQRAAFESNAAAIAAEREDLAWKAKEIEALAFTAEGWSELAAEHRRLAHAASLIEGSQLGLEVLSESEGSSLSQLNAVIAKLQGLVEHDQTLREVLDVLEPAAIQIQEGVYTLRHYQQKLDVDPQRLREADRRIEAVHSACRKYRTTPEALPTLLDRARTRLAELDAGGDPEALLRLEEEARDEYLREAKKLSTGRRKTAAALAKEVSSTMQSLAMAGATFDVAFTALAEPSSHGLEQIEFRVAAHAAMTPQPLAKVASGGELSRLSLAIQTVTSRVAQVPTLVFDEVDAGIGGRVAEIVGQMLKALGREHQVMCITHLPQVAASAHHQWQVSKSSSKARISSRVTALAAEQRIDEIARMLGGVKITETTRKHAAEMLGVGERRGK